MNNWQIGDRAVCTRPGSVLEGLEVTIIRGLHTYTPSDWPGTSEVGYTVDPGFSSENGYSYASQPQYLKPIPDDFTRYHNELAEKGPCVWEWKETCNVDS